MTMQLSDPITLCAHSAYIMSQIQHAICISSSANTKIGTYPGPCKDRVLRTCPEGEDSNRQD
jgi:hypothetical protein